eukprot:TRINITY_DN19217_c0_g1_i1.p1 TRINITY_DN19217_c0_g1~~TRINITY_DN19217_c0_g1_i1.p1  ORF type:complete len:658 (+),score=159.09 TRINITY_DN19217_c0_g1_i1:133-2106(+)
MGESYKWLTLMVYRTCRMDLRSLALMRVCLGLTIIYDIVNRFRDLHPMYCDDGVLPRFFVQEYLQSEYWMSFYMQNGSGLWVASLLVVHMLAALSMTVGFYTRTATWLLYVLTNSLNNRNVLVMHGGDLYMRVVLFWAALLPTGAACSIDNTFFHKPKRRHGDDWTVASVASFAFALQIGVMYFASAIWKSGPAWFPDGTATFLALQIDFLRGGLGNVLINMPHGFLKVLTIAIWHWEKYASFLFFVPVYPGLFRFVGAAGFFLMHLGFWLCMRLETFCPLCMSALLCLLPHTFWELVFFGLRTRRRMSVRVHYEPRCRLCSGLLRAYGTFFLLPDTQYVPLDVRQLAASYAAAKLANPASSARFRLDAMWAVECEGQCYADVSAIVPLLSASPLLAPLAWLISKFPPSDAFGEQFMRVVVHNHDAADSLLSSGAALPNELSNVTSLAVETTGLRPATRCRRDSKRKRRLLGLVRQGARWLRDAFLLVLIFSLVGWNFRQFPDWQAYSLQNGFVIELVQWLQLDQIWDMFSPQPATLHWHYIMPGKLLNGTELELWGNGGMFHFQGRPMTWDKPDIPESVGDHRWMKYYERYNNHAAKLQIRLHFGRWLCRQWNAPERHSGPTLLKSFDVYFVSQEQRLDGTRVDLPRQTLWNHVCF